MRATGYLTIASPTAATVERDTATCCHCGAVIVLKPRQPPPGHCMRCDKVTCERCTAAGRCVPFERQLERMEARDRLVRACEA